MPPRCNRASGRIYEGLNVIALVAIMIAIVLPIVQAAMKRAAKHGTNPVVEVFSFLSFVVGFIGAMAAVGLVLAILAAGIAYLTGRRTDDWRYVIGEYWRAAFVAEWALLFIGLIGYVIWKK